MTDSERIALPPMRQRPLFPPAPKRRRSALTISNSFDELNLYNARLVLADPAKYGGEASGMVIWARMVIRRLEGPAA